DPSCRRFPHLRRGLRAHRQRAGQLDRRPLDVHLSPDVLQVRFRRRLGRRDPPRRDHGARLASRGRDTEAPVGGGGAVSVIAAAPLRSALGASGRYVLLAAVSILFIIPILWIFSTSFKTPGEIFAVPTTLLPQQPTVANYAAVAAGGFRSYLVNSLIAAS